MCSMQPCLLCRDYSNGEQDELDTSVGAGTYDCQLWDGGVLHQGEEGFGWEEEDGEEGTPGASLAEANGREYVGTQEGNAAVSEEADVEGSGGVRGGASCVPEARLCAGNEGEGGAAAVAAGQLAVKRQRLQGMTRGSEESGEASEQQQQQQQQQHPRGGGVRAQRPRRRGGVDGAAGAPPPFLDDDLSQRLHALADIAELLGEEPPPPPHHHHHGPGSRPGNAARRAAVAAAAARASPGAHPQPRQASRLGPGLHASPSPAAGGSPVPSPLPSQGDEGLDAAAGGSTKARLSRAASGCGEAWDLPPMHQALEWHLQGQDEAKAGGRGWCRQLGVQPPTNGPAAPGDCGWRKMHVADPTDKEEEQAEGEEVCRQEALSCLLRALRTLGAGGACMLKAEAALKQAPVGQLAALKVGAGSQERAHHLVLMWWCKHMCAIALLPTCV